MSRQGEREMDKGKRELSLYFPQRKRCFTNAQPSQARDARKVFSFFALSSPAALDGKCFNNDITNVSPHCCVINYSDSRVNESFDPAERTV